MERIPSLKQLALAGLYRLLLGLERCCSSEGARYSNIGVYPMFDITRMGYKSWKDVIINPNVNYIELKIQSISPLQGFCNLDCTSTMEKIPSLN